MTATYTWAPQGVALSWTGAPHHEGRTLPQCVGAYLQNRSHRAIELRRVTAFWPVQSNVQTGFPARHLSDLVRLASEPSGGAVVTALRLDEDSAAMPAEVTVRRAPSRWSASSKIRDVPPLYPDFRPPWASFNTVGTQMRPVVELFREYGGADITPWRVQEGEGIALVPNMTGERCGMGVGYFDAQLVLRVQSTGACYSYLLPNLVVSPSGLGAFSVWNESGSGVVLEVVKVDLLASTADWSTNSAVLGSVCLYRVPAALPVSGPNGADVRGEAIEWDVTLHDTDQPLPEGLDGGSVTGHVGSFSLDDGSVAVRPNTTSAGGLPVESTRWASDVAGTTSLLASNSSAGIFVSPSRAFAERRIRSAIWAAPYMDVNLTMPQRVAGQLLDDCKGDGWIVRPGEALAVSSPPFGVHENQGVNGLASMLPVLVLDLEVTFNVVLDQGVRPARSVGGQWTRGLMP